MAKTTPSIWKKTIKSGNRYEWEMAKAEGRIKRREAKEEKILSVAARLFWEQGYLGTSIDEIAKMANMNKASVYYYFESKSVLLNEVISRPLQQMIEDAIPITGSDAKPTEKLKSLITTHINWQLSRLGVTGIGHIERKNLPADLARKYIELRDSYEILFRKVIAEGIEKGEFSFKSAKLATLFCIGLLTSITQWYRVKGQYSIDEIASMASNYILRAMENCNGKETSDDC